MRRALFVLLSFLSYAHSEREFGHARWYIESTGLDTSSLFVDMPIRFTFVSPGPFKLSLPPECPKVEVDGAANEILFFCETPGEKELSVTSSSGVDALFLLLRRTPECYDWYLKFDRPLGTPHELPFETWMKADIWIYDRVRATSAELSESASSPGSDALALTAELQHLGETPLLFIAQDGSGGLDPPVYFSDEPLADFVPERNAAYEVLLPSPQFNSSTGTWQTYMLTRWVAAVPLLVYGKAVSILNCQVRNRTIDLSIRSDIPGSLPLSASSEAVSATGFHFQVDACSNNIGMAAFVPHNLNFLFTQDGFLTSTLNKILKGTSVFDVSAVSTVVVVAGRVVLVTPTKLYARDNEPDAQFEEATGLPLAASEMPNRIAVLNICNPRRSPGSRTSFLNKVVLAWRHDNAGGSGQSVVTVGGQWAAENRLTYYVSYDVGTTFLRQTGSPEVKTGTEIGSPPDPDADMGGYSILEISPLPSFAHNVLLVSGVGRADQQRLVLHQASSEPGSGRYYFGFRFPKDKPELQPGAGGHLYAAHSSSGELLIYGQTLWYSADGGYSAHIVKMISRDVKRPGGEALTTDETIKAVSTSVNGNLAVLTTLNRLFIGACGLPSVVEIQSGIALEAVATLVHDPFNRLLVYTLTFDANNKLVPPYLKKRMYTVESEILTYRRVLSDPSPQVCPYKDRYTDMKATYYLDKAEEATFTVGLVPNRGIRSILGVSLSDQNVLEFEVSHSTSFGNLMGHEQLMTVVLREERQPREASPDADLDMPGEASIRIVPSDVNLQCPLIQSVANVRVGCPPSRHIRVRHIENKLESEDLSETGEHCTSYQPGGKNSEFRVPRDALSDFVLNTIGDAEELVATYDYAKYGCPKRFFFSNAGYRPVVELYDGDVLVRELTANYIVWELQGRTDFSFNVSMGAAKCAVKPQSWDEMTGGVPVDPTSMDQYWNQHNYLDCFVSHPDRSTTYRELSPYQVMSSAVWNGITFTRFGGVFLFQVRVVDPEYSYCDLSATFGMYVFGTPLSQGISMTIIGVCTLIVVAVLVASYFVYRKNKLKKD